MSLGLALSAVLLAAFLLIGTLDLGVGFLLLLVARGRDRDAALAVGGRAWSAGAIWTLVDFALLVAGLPATLVPLRALWPALVLTLLSLTLRGVAVALRPHVLRRDLVDLAFGLASLVTACCQGLMLGWFIAGLGPNPLVRHAGPTGMLSIWGLLCAGGVVGLSALLGSGWLVLSGRDALGVFGREVGRAAAMLLAGAAALGAIWAVWPTGVAAQAFARGWTSGLPPAFMTAASLGLLVPFGLSLWGKRPAVPLSFAVLAAVCAFVAVAELVFVGGGASAELGLSAAYLTLTLLIGSPLLVFDLLGRTLVLRKKAEAHETPLSHAGRRSGSLANNLHLS